MMPWQCFAGHNQKQTNFTGVGWYGPGQHRGGLAAALGEAQASGLWPCRLSQDAPERALELPQGLTVATDRTIRPLNEIEP